MMNDQFHDATVFEGTSNCTKMTSTTTAASKIITASFAMLFYVAVLVLSVLGTFYTWWRKLLSMQATYVLFFVGALMVSINILTNKGDSVIRMYYRIASGFLVGIIYVIVGGIVFFQKPPSCTVDCKPVANWPCVRHRHENTAALAHYHPSMGIVVGAITLTLVLIELLLFAGIAKAIIQESRKFNKSWCLFLISEITYLVQKVFQAITYVFLRHRMPSPHLRECASFYFKVLSFFNLIMWLDDTVNLHKNVELTSASGLYGPAFPIMATMYKALLIDYRLLCSLLFLEHSLEINEDRETEIEIQETQSAFQDESFNSYSTQCGTDRTKRIMGYLIGLFCLLAQLICFVQLSVGAGVHVMLHNVIAVLVSTFLTLGGMLLLHKNNLELQQSSHEARSGVTKMVCCMGAVGFTCWIIQAAFAAILTVISSGEDHTHLSWAAGKMSIRAIGTLFLMVVFAKVNAHVIVRQNPNVKINNFLVPAMMLGILSGFVGTTIDREEGTLNNKLRCVSEVNEASLNLLFEAGPAVYLGFCIHVFLHFFIILRRMDKRVALGTRGNQATEASPLLGFHQE